MRFRLKKHSNPLPQRRFTRTDIWLERLGYLAQIGLLILAVVGYYYTVIPLYQKSLLDEQIAKKELEINSLNLTISRLYDKNRAYDVYAFSQKASMACAGVYPTKTSIGFHGGKIKFTSPTALILEIDGNECVIEIFLKSNELEKNLSPADYSLLKNEVKIVANKLNISRLNFKTKFKNYYLQADSTSSAKTNHESNVIVSEYADSIYEIIGKLNEINWSKKLHS